MSTRKTRPTIMERAVEGMVYAACAACHLPAASRSVVRGWAVKKIIGHREKGKVEAGRDRASNARAIGRQAASVHHNSLLQGRAQSEWAVRSQWLKQRERETGLCHGRTTYCKQGTGPRTLAKWASKTQDPRPKTQDPKVSYRHGNCNRPR